MGREGVVIQINTEEALKRLIDGDPEFAIEIRKSAAIGIAKAYETIISKRYNKDATVQAITSVVKTEIADATARAREIATDTLFEYTGQGWSRAKHLKPELRESITNAAMLEFNGVVRGALDEKTKNVIDELNARLDKQMNEIVESVTAMVTSDAMKDEVDRRVREELARIREGLSDVHD